MISFEYSYSTREDVVLYNLGCSSLIDLMFLFLSSLKCLFSFYYFCIPLYLVVLCSIHMDENDTDIYSTVRSTEQI